MRQISHLSRFTYGRGDRTRTCGILVPNQALYQTELHLATVAIIFQITNSFIISQIVCLVNTFFLLFRRKQKKCTNAASPFHAVFPVKRRKICIWLNQFRIAEPLFCRIVKSDHSFTRTGAGLCPNVRCRKSVRNRLRLGSLVKKLHTTTSHQKCRRISTRRHSVSYQKKVLTMQ